MTARLTVSQYNAPPGYTPFTAQVALNSAYSYDNEGKLTLVTYSSVSNIRQRKGRALRPGPRFAIQKTTLLFDGVDALALPFGRLHRQTEPLADGPAKPPRWKRDADLLAWLDSL